MASRLHSGKRPAARGRGHKSEHAAGIEPASPAWKAGASPLGHACMRAAEESNLAGRFWRPARSQIATQGGGRRDSNPLGTRSQRAGSTLRPRPQCARSESNRARPLIERLHDRRATGTWSGWLELPQRPPVPETGAHLTELHPEGALVWNRTSISRSSAGRHHQIGYEGVLVAGVVPGHEHRRLFGCQRAFGAVRGRGLEPRYAGSKPAGLPLADPRADLFRDQDSNLDFCVQSAEACR
jgi:hypothetical protein